MQNRMRKSSYVSFIRLALVGFAIGALLGLITGCNSFERTTFQALSTSKAVIDQAQTDYEARTLPHTEPVYKAINDAKDAQHTAVDALLTYEQVKTAKGTQTALQSQQQLVVIALGKLPVFIADIKAFYVPAVGK